MGSTEYIVRFKGDYSALEKDIKKISGATKKLEDDEVIIKLNYDGNIKEFNKVFDHISKLHPELGIQFQYNVNEKILRQELDKLEKLTDLKLDIDEGKVPKKLESMADGIKNALNEGVSKDEIERRVKDFFGYYNTAIKAGAKNIDSDFDDINKKLFDYFKNQSEEIRNIYDEIFEKNDEKGFELFKIDGSLNNDLVKTKERVDDLKGALKGLEEKGASKSGLPSELQRVQDEIKILRSDIEEMKGDLKNLSGDAFINMTQQIKDTNEQLAIALKKVSELKGTLSSNGIKKNTSVGGVVRQWQDEEETKSRERYTAFNSQTKETSGAHLAADATGTSMKLMKAAIDELGDEAEGTIHSHPMKSAAFSDDDIERYITLFEESQGKIFLNAITSAEQAMSIDMRKVDTSKKEEIVKTIKDKYQEIDDKYLNNLQLSAKEIKEDMMPLLNLEAKNPIISSVIKTIRENYDDLFDGIMNPDEFSDVFEENADYILKQIPELKQLSKEDRASTLKGVGDYIDLLHDSILSTVSEKAQVEYQKVLQDVFTKPEFLKSGETSAIKLETLTDFIDWGSIEDSAAEATKKAGEAVKKAQDSNSPAELTKSLGKDFGAGYAEGIREAIPDIVAACKEIVLAAYNALKEAGETENNDDGNFSDNFVNKFKTSLEEAIPNLQEKIKEVFSKIDIGDENKSMFTGIGQEIIDSIIVGLKDEHSASSFAETIENAINNAFKNVALDSAVRNFLVEIQTTLDLQGALRLKYFSVDTDSIVFEIQNGLNNKTFNINIGGTIQDLATTLDTSAENVRLTFIDAIKWIREANEIQKGNAEETRERQLFYNSKTGEFSNPTVVGDTIKVYGELVEDFKSRLQNAIDESGLYLVEIIGTLSESFRNDIITEMESYTDPYYYIEIKGKLTETFKEIIQEAIDSLGAFPIEVKPYMKKGGEIEEIDLPSGNKNGLLLDTTTPSAIDEIAQAENEMGNEAESATEKIKNLEQELENIESRRNEIANSEEYGILLGKAQQDASSLSNEEKTKYFQLDSELNNLLDRSSEIKKQIEIIRFDNITSQIEEVTQETDIWYRRVLDIRGILQETGGFFANSIELAKSYMNGNNSMVAATVDKSKFLTVDAKGQKWDELWDITNELEEKVKEKGIDPLSFVSDVTNTQRGNTKYISDLAKALGYLGVEIQNVVDVGARGENQNLVGNIIQVFDESVIQRVFNITDAVKGLNNSIEELQKVGKVKIRLPEQFVMDSDYSDLEKELFKKVYGTDEEIYASGNGIAGKNSLLGRKIKIAQQLTEEQLVEQNKESDKLLEDLRFGNIDPDDFLRQYEEFLTRWQALIDKQSQLSNQTPVSSDESTDNINDQTEALEREEEQAKETAKAKEEAANAGEENNNNSSLLSKKQVVEQLRTELNLTKKAAEDLFNEQGYGKTNNKYQIEQSAVDELIASLKEKKEIEGSQDSPSASPTANAMQSEVEAVSQAIETEKKKFDELKRKIGTSIPNAIKKKNEAFKEEADLVSKLVGGESKEFDNLKDSIDGVTDSIKDQGKAGKDSKSQGTKNTSNEPDRDAILRQHYADMRRDAFQSIGQKSDVQKDMSKYYAELEKKSSEAYADANKKTESLLNKIKKLQNSGKFTDEFISELNLAEQELTEFAEQLKGKAIPFEELESKVTALGEKIEGTLAKKTFNNVKQAAEKSLTNVGLKIDQIIAKNSAMGESFKTRFEGLKKELGSAKSIEDVQRIVAEVNRLESEIISAGKTGKSFIDQIKQRLRDINSKYIAQYFSFQDIIRYARQAITNVIELNDAFIELSKVSDTSLKALEADFQSYANIAKNIGGTITDTINATADWARMGYNVPDSKQLAEVAMLYKNVGDGIDISQANESLISTLQGYQMGADEAEHIVDVFNEVANNFAIYSGGIGEALQRSAASLNAANTSLEESVALVTAANTVVQNPESVGTTFKTLSARIRGKICAHL